jgi:four helix bundle protein
MRDAKCGMPEVKPHGIRLMSLHGRLGPTFNHMKNKDLKGLDAWSVAMDFATDVYRSSAQFPKEETFGLRLQLRRASVSIASNVAEGHGRIRNADYARFVLVARGSLKEAETQVILASRLGYIPQDAECRLTAQTERLSELLGGLHRSLRQKRSSDADRSG